MGPHPKPWPDDPRLDPDLLEHGDRRNVIDRYRYWTVSAIVADLETRRHSLHIAIQNWEHDFNIGSIVRPPTPSTSRVQHHRSAVEPAGSNGHRPLSPCRAPFLGRRLRRPADRTATSSLAWTIWTALCRWRPTSYRSGHVWCSAQRAWAHRRAGGCLRTAGRHHSVRLHPIHQRWCRGGHRDVPLGTPLGRPTQWL